MGLHKQLSFPINFFEAHHLFLSLGWLQPGLGPNTRDGNQIE
jgi:hypothetical protein